MPIPGPGTAISINTIVAEFGGTAPHSLSEYYRGGGLVPNTPTNSAIPTSGQIAIGNFYGSANRSTVALTISGNTYNYDVYANRGPSYVAGATDLTVTVNPGVLVGSTSTGTYAMLVPSAFNPGDTVTIVNNGVIQGMGGAGGRGGQPNSPNSVPIPSLPGVPGSGGGNALYVNRPTTVTNNGTLAAGGGGGGGGGGAGIGPPKQVNEVAGGGGGGGGAGFNGGGGGAGGTFNVTPGRFGSPGGSGTSPSGGGGGAGGAGFPPAPGGSGGGRGANGSSGTAGSGSPPAYSSSGGGGGGAGNYIVGNPFVTYPVTGTRQGGVA